jgi:hypothetical protein
MQQLPCKDTEYLIGMVKLVLGVIEVGFILSIPYWIHWFGQYDEASAINVYSTIHTIPIFLLH